MGTSSESIGTTAVAKWALALTMFGAASLANQELLLFALATLCAFLASLGSARSVSVPAPALILALFLAMYRLSDGAHLTPVLFTITIGLLACLAAANLTRSGVPYVTVVGTLVIGVTLHAVLNLGLLLREHGLRPDTRLFGDFWTMSALGATAQAALWTPLVGLLPLLFVWRRRARGVLVSLLVVGAVFLAASLLASRTLILLLSVILFGWLLVGRYFTSGTPRLSGTTSAVVGAIGFVTTAVVWVFPDAVRGLPLFARLTSPDASLGDDPRIERWTEYATRGWDHFYGGGHLRMEIGYGHNLWLDVLDMAGIPALVCLTAFSALYLYHAVSLARSRSFTVGERVTSLSLAVVVTSQAATEPLLEGMPIIFVIMCGLAGATATARQARLPEHDRSGVRPMRAVH